MVTLMEWPKDRIPPGAISSLEDLEGRRPRSAIIEGEPILDAKLLESGAMHDPIAQLPKGYRSRLSRSMLRRAPQACSHPATGSTCSSSSTQRAGRHHRAP